MVRYHIQRIGWYFWRTREHLADERCLTTENNEQVNRGRPVLTLRVHLHRNDAKVSALSGARQLGAERLTGTVEGWEERFCGRLNKLSHFDNEATHKATMAIWKPNPTPKSSNEREGSQEGGRESSVRQVKRSKTIGEVATLESQTMGRRKEKGTKDVSVNWNYWEHGSREKAKRSERSSWWSSGGHRRGR
ncbi:unnamed protein product [Heterotrigona itama]|uniref:Uncharacterized protein n=1 Tax=Heterotrigona itama TaxID=395501 RepID=A0A6V7HAJ8_9HYME|nr:unnamed protein product [Heterotrigona itama]